MSPAKRRKRPTGQVGALVDRQQNNAAANKPKRPGAQAELDRDDLELLWSVEQLVARGGAPAVYGLLVELGMRRMVRSEIDITIRQHLQAHRRAYRIVAWGGPVS